MNTEEARRAKRLFYTLNGPVSSLLLTPFFIQPIYHHVKSRHRVSFFGSCSQVAFFVGDAAFFILPVIYIYIDIDIDIDIYIISS